MGEIEAEPKLTKQVRKGVAKARAKDSDAGAGEAHARRRRASSRIRSDPPLIVPAEELMAADETRDIEQFLLQVLDSYRASLPADRQHLLDGYRFRHLARKVVGVGSVGTRAWVVLLTGADDADPLFLQAKEAEASVLEPYAGASRFKNHGRRVVEGQRLMQAASDIFLGWCPAVGLDGGKRDFYVRQLWDWKRSVEVERLTPHGLELVRADVRLDPGPRPRPLRRPDRDRRLPRRRRRLRPGDRRVLRALRRPERARPRGASHGDRGRSHRRRGVLMARKAGAGAAGLILMTLCAGQFLMMLDSSVMNVSIATVAQDVGTTVTGIQTAITLYTLVMASFMITGGKIGQIIGRKRAFAIGCVIYGCGSTDHGARAEPDRAADRLVVPGGPRGGADPARDRRPCRRQLRPLPRGPAPTASSPPPRRSRWRSARSSAASSPPTSPGATSSPARS